MLSIGCAIMMMVPQAERHRLRDEFVNWRQPYEDLKLLRTKFADWRNFVLAVRHPAPKALKISYGPTEEQKRAIERVKEFKLKEAAKKKAEAEEEARQLALEDPTSTNPEMEQTEDQDVAVTAVGTDADLESASEPELETEAEPGQQAEPADWEAVLARLQATGNRLVVPSVSQPAAEPRKGPDPEIVETVEDEDGVTHAYAQDPGQELSHAETSVVEPALEGEQDHELSADAQQNECGTKAPHEFEPVHVTPLLDSLTLMLTAEDSADEIVEELPDVGQRSLVEPSGSGEGAELVPEMLVQEEELHLGPTTQQLMYPLGGPFASESSDEEPSGQRGLPALAAPEVLTSELHPAQKSDGSEAEFLELSEVEDEMEDASRHVGEEASEKKGPQDGATVTRKVRLGT